MELESRAKKDKGKGKQTSQQPAKDNGEGSSGQAGKPKGKPSNDPAVPESPEKPPSPDRKPSPPPSRGPSPQTNTPLVLAPIQNSVHYSIIMCRKRHTRGINQGQGEKEVARRERLVGGLTGHTRNGLTVVDEGLCCCGKIQWYVRGLVTCNVDNGCCSLYSAVPVISRILLVVIVDQCTSSSFVSSSPPSSSSVQGFCTIIVVRIFLIVAVFLLITLLG
jgi:hypothetical protein